MDALHHTTRTAAITPAIASAGLLLACLVATPAMAQQSAPAQGATATPAGEAHAAGTTTPATPMPARKRSGFGAAMAQLTQALREASEQAATPPAKADATPEPTQAKTQAAATDGALAVESPP